MKEVKTFRLGVVEGFFGKTWSWEARRHYARFLSGNGFTTYLYAPKNDVYFRKHWTTPCPRDHHEALRGLSDYYRSAGVEFGIGLSPFELYREFSSEGKAALERKIDEINSINPDTLCILFDDMQGAMADLATLQLHIMDYVTRTSSARQFMFCPTYYSYDPALTQFFGAMPDNYLEELGSQLDSRIDIFWTGPRVFSESFPDDHLLEISDRFKRKPLLWDNYPVNDSKRLCGYLHLNPFENRDEGLKSLAQGHMANPMNQAYLSKLPLYTLSRIYQGLESNNMLEEACAVLCPPKLAPLLQEDSAAFQEKGLEKLDESTRAELMEKYRPFEDHPMVQELFGWLQGEYAFDPACLT